MLWTPRPSSRWWLHGDGYRYPFPPVGGASPGPSVGGTNGGFVDTAANPIVCNLPLGIVSGDWLVVFVTLRLAGTDTTHTWPTGWTELFDVPVGSPVQVRFLAARRLADGTEGSTINLSLGAARVATHASARITGADTATPPEAATVAGPNDNTNATPDPPNLAPTWGSAETLWLAASGAYQSNALSVAVSAYPTNYTGGVDYRRTANDVGTAFANRLLTAASENPGTYTLANGCRWIAATVALRPATGATGGKNLTMLGVG